jgi:hypothetical protein
MLCERYFSEYDMRIHGAGNKKVYSRLEHGKATKERPVT